MPAFMRPRFWIALRHRLCVAGTFFAYLLATLSIPLPASIHKDTDQPFPCQDHPCGCQTAEQCWRQCCCFTPEERWAWARAHHVEPPAYAEKPTEKPAAEGWNTVKLRDREKQKAKPAAKSCCRTSPGRSSCCQTTSERPAKQPPAKSGRVRWGTALSAWQCQGGTTLWVSIGAVLPVPLPAVWSPDRPPPSRVSLMNTAAHYVPLNPPAPPPRLSIV